MPRYIKLTLIVIGLFGVASAQQAINPRPYFTEPSLSPDRKEIAA